MQFQVTQIEFDFDDAFEVENYDQDIIDEVLATTWEADDEDDLIEMGYDRADCETVAVAGVEKTFPMNIHGRVYQTQEEYDQALHDFLNGQ